MNVQCMGSQLSRSDGSEVTVRTIVLDSWIVGRPSFLLVRFLQMDPEASFGFE